MAISGTTFNPVPLLSHDDDPNWKVERYPLTANGGNTIATVKPGYLVKFNAGRNGVIPALAADDALLEGVILDKDYDDVTNAAGTTVGIARTGSFDKNTIKYGDGSQPISAAGLTTLNSHQIYLDAAIAGGAFAP